MPSNTTQDETPKYVQNDVQVIDLKPALKDLDLQSPESKVVNPEIDIFTAVETRLYQDIHRLIELGVDINSIEATSGFTPLMVASQAGDFEAIKILLAYKPNLIIKNKEGQNAIQISSDISCTALMYPELIRQIGISTPLDSRIEEVFILIMDAHSELFPGLRDWISSNIPLPIASLKEDKCFGFLWQELETAEAMEHIAKQIAEKIKFLGIFEHGLGIMPYFPDEAPFAYGEAVRNTLLNDKRFISNLFTLMQAHSLSFGYYNVPLQESLINSLNKFIVTQAQRKNEEELLQESPSSIHAMQTLLKQLKSYIEAIPEEAGGDISLELLVQLMILIQTHVNEFKVQKTSNKFLEAKFESPPDQISHNFSSHQFFSDISESKRKPEEPSNTVIFHCKKSRYN